MNDPDRRHSSGASDYDAIFADIVAHLNDDPSEDGPIARPAAGDLGTGPIDQVDPVADQENEPTIDQPHGQAQDQTEDPGALSTDLSPVDRPPDDRDPWPLTRPQVLPGQGDQTSGPDGPQSVPPPQVWRAHEVDDEYEEHFEPPAASPLPAGDLQFWAIIAGMGGGPLLLLYLVFFNRDASSYWILTAIALCIGGFALLVSRMPGNHEDDDDGARL